MGNIWADEGLVNSFVHFFKDKTPAKPDEIFTYGRVDLIESLAGSGDTNCNILDIGCGDGDLLENFHTHPLRIGMDISAMYCSDAKKKVPGSEIVLASMCDLPFKDNSFDKIVAVYSVIYAADKEKTLREISRILKEDGIFVLFDPNRLSLRTLIRRLMVIWLKLTGDVKNPRFIHHSVATKQSMSYWDFKNKGKKSHLTLASFCGVFTYHLIVPKKLRPFIFGKLQYKKWGFIPGLKCFSDFLIIKFVKESPSP